MEKSKIFTKTELEEMDKRKKGDKSDKFGVWSARARPKVKELVEEWLPKERQLKELLKRKKKKKDDNK